MGGLARRVGYVKALGKLVNNQVPVLQLDAGHMLTDELNAVGIMDDPRVKNEWMLRAYWEQDLAAANVSPRDVPYLSELMTKKDHAASVKKFPLLERFVSANVLPAGPDHVAFEPYLIREVRGGRVGSAPIRVAVLGVSEIPRRPMAKGAAYTIADPVEAARKYVPELRKKADLVVVLAYTDRETARRIGAEAPGIDMILTARQYPVYNQVDEAGDAVVAFVANETRYLGEIRLYRKDGAKAGPIERYVHRNVPLDDVVPDDPTARDAVLAAKKAFTRTPSLK
jgi:2',3'-cyclic-nucleotide 2'-phosphodiesterase (5'-nucleotidase family)